MLGIRETDCPCPRSVFPEGVVAISVPTLLMDFLVSWDCTEMGDEGVSMTKSSVSHDPVSSQETTTSSSTVNLLVERG